MGSQLHTLVFVAHMLVNQSCWAGPTTLGTWTAPREKPVDPNVHITTAMLCADVDWRNRWSMTYDHLKLASRTRGFFKSPDTSSAHER